jgi:chromosome segregation ATPase
MMSAQRKSQIEQNIDLKRLAQKQRKQEYNKSMSKHPEYPSVPEYQNKFRDRHEKELVGLEEAHKVAMAEFDKATEQLAFSLAQALPLEIEAVVQRHMQGQFLKPTGVDDAKIKDLEASFEARISALDNLIESKTAVIKNEVNQAHDNHNQLKASLPHQRTEFENRLTADLEKKMAAQQNLIDGLLDSHKRLEEQIIKVQNERKMAQANQELQQEQNRALHADVSKIRLENGRLRDDLEYLRENAARRSELGDMKTDCGDVKTENARLSTLLCQIKDDNKAMSTRFGEYAELTREHQITMSRLDAASEDHRAGLSRLDLLTRRHGDELTRLDLVTKNHQDELSRLDLTMLEEVAEGWGIEWPNVLDAIQAFDGVRARVDKLESVFPDVVRYKDRLEHVEEDAQTFARTVAEVKDCVVRLTPARSAQTGETVSRQGSVGSRSDKEDRFSQDLMSRLLTVEDKLRKSEEKVTQAGAFENSALFRISQVQDNVTRRVKNIETRLNELPVQAFAQIGTQTPSQQDPGISTLTSKVDHCLGELEKLSTEFRGMGEKVNFFKNQVKQLETRFEELSQQAPARSLLHFDPEVSKFKTKVEKFEGDFEKLSTEVQGVSAHFEYLNHQVTALDSQYNNITTKPLAEHILAHMELVYPTNREIIANMQELQRRMTCSEQDTRETVEELRQRVNLAIGQHAATGHPAVAGIKRRRVDDSANGSPRPSVNGAERSTGSPAGIRA